MIVPDINLLLYAHLTAFPQHVAAASWWGGVLTATELVGLAPPVVLGFVRIATSRKVFDPPMTVEAAVSTVDGWFARPQVRHLDIGRGQLATALTLMRAAGTGGNLTTDALIASAALHAGGTVYSNDADFARFSGVAWRNPLR